MKKYLFLLMALFIANLSYASFPVTEKEESQEQVEVLNTLSKPISNGGGGWAIAALSCGVVGLFVAPIILGPLAIIFGALGLKKNLKGMAIAGLILGIIETLIIGLLVGLILAVA